MSTLTLDTIIATMREIRTIPPVPSKIIVSDNVITRREDWSACRSKPRAMRRLKTGKPQRMVVRYDPACYTTKDTIFMHPVIERRMQETMQTRMRKTEDEFFRKAIYGY